MEWNKIEALLERYFEGLTTLEEEQALKTFFQGTNVPPHLESYRSLFGYFAQAKQERMTPPIQLKSRRNVFIGWLVAASVVVMLGIGFMTWNAPSDAPQALAQTELGTYDSPEEAYAATQEALAMVSGHLNTGIESMGYLKEYENSKNQIFKQ